MAVPSGADVGPGYLDDDAGDEREPSGTTDTRANGRRRHAVGDAIRQQVEGGNGNGDADEHGSTVVASRKSQVASHESARVTNDL